MSNRKLLDAKFTDCVLTNVNMESAELCFANFSGSHLENCSMKYTTADEINLRDATLKNCDLSYILLAHASFYKSDLFNCRIANSCYEGTRFVGTSTKDQYIDTDSTMTNEEWTHPTEGQVMQ